jgi:hypothetical protein
MRRQLQQQVGVRKTFTATFSKTGKKVNFKGHSEDTLLLVNVRDAETNELMSDHVWFTYSKTFDKADLKEGMKISFDARVKEYTKGYVNRALGVNKKKRDFKLSHPTNVMIMME